MKIPNCLVFALAGALLCAPAVYAASSSASGNVSATCKDGSSWSGKSHSGACRGHGGVQGWSDSGAAATTSTSESKMTSTRKSRSRKSETAATGGVSTSSMSSNSGASANASATCKDGTSWSGKSHSGACRGHKGVQSWSDAGANAAPTAPPPVATPTTRTTPMQPASNTPVTQSRVASTKPGSAPAPGGGAGQVWVNASTKVYHCPNDRWYGKTKNGQYMSESQAQARGFRPDHGKACTQ